ncbi:hypothetical protein DEJ25_13610 [Curtobacterium sp. MCPF17_011]|uniref:hypothetical protein n=1 Tax=Curtobacterium sp. MCPF17_011 TaxID=2175652 RepID=UPI000DA8D40A|nr:hypothetical protein [Curtobacterium sp. MCPF17_011]PZF10005.1 hypothetical protein DEJ25_13610 [Curtobacterium sp. MCPF17_011]
MTDSDDILDGVFDAGAQAIMDSMRAIGLIDEQQVEAAGRNTAPFKRRDIRRSSRRITAARIEPMVVGWRAEDNHGKHAGGRPPVLTVSVLCTMVLLLAEENSPLLISDIANALHVRLTKKAREELGIANVKKTGNPKRDYWNWYMRVKRALDGIIELMDAWPVDDRRKAMLLEERERQMQKRDPLMQAVKAPRSSLFIDALLDMSMRSLPQQYQDAWEGFVSVDQTSLATFSQLMQWKKDHELPGSPEVPDEVYIDVDGQMKWVPADRPVVEVDATPYPLDKGRQNKDFDGPASDFEQSFAASLFLSVTDPGKPDAHPQLIVAASLHQWGRSVAERTVAGIDSLLERGWAVKRLTADRGYSANISVDGFRRPMAERGIGLVIDYKGGNSGGQLGVQKQTVHGLLEIEGGLYCPGTPVDLRTATEDARKRLITPSEYFKKVKSREPYLARQRSGGPDENGAIRLRCPARGKSPTVTCPLVEMHAQASKSPDIHRPPIDEDLVPLHPDLICCQDSVKLEWDDALTTRQELHYASDEWLSVFGHDRQSMEGFNSYLKNKRNLGDASKRQMRGLAAQAFLLGFILTAANFARINKFLHDRAAGVVTPIHRERLRDREGRSDYKRFPTKPQRRRGMRTVDKRNAAKEAAKAAPAGITNGQPSALGRRRGRRLVDE